MKHARRVFHIYRVLATYEVDEVLGDSCWRWLFRVMRWVTPWHRQMRRTLPRGERIRIALTALGPIFVKFGQALSTRPDVLPVDITQALAQLQDQVGAFCGDIAQAKIVAALQKPLAQVFSTFETTPMASASIAQVHGAVLHDGRAVVVKVLRPDIRRHMLADLLLMKRVAKHAERFWSISRRFKPVALVEEFERYLLDELDLKREGANAAQLKRNFQGSDALYVPNVIWEYTSDEILVMERIEGIPVSDRAQLEAAGINIPKLAALGVEIFFTQVFRDSFFHADMHPGNIFVSRETPQHPRYICVDFGVMGSLSEEDQRYLAHNLFAFFTRDYRRVAQLHIESGWVAKDTRVEVFESAIRTVCEPIFDRPLGQISFANLMLEFFQVAEKFQMQVQPQLLLLQKTLLAVEGLGRQLYPDLDLWQTAKPFLERWLKSRISGKVLWHQLKTQLPFLVEQLPQLPRVLYDALSVIAATKPGSAPP